MLIRSLRSLRPACTIAVVAPFAMIVACSSAPTRQGFVDDVPAAASTPAEMPAQSAPPPKTTQSGPDTTGSDAGIDGADGAADTCVRSAPSNKCGVFPQCGCTLAQTCDVPDSSGNAECVVAGTAKMGAPCVATAGCAVGLTCLFGICHAFCGNPGNACGIAKTGSCVQIKDSAMAAVPNLSVCNIACDLRDANACGGTTAAGSGACVLDANNETDCATAGTAPLNGTCGGAVDCGATLVCVVTGSATTGSCKKWCRVGQNDCGGTTACGAFGTPLMVGGVQYGACP
ncbi:MAG: hypothetical protein QOI41_5033 [Myxococcales bacterium]|jgi:hypothetical protein|nr:hypothetical protein [Myxococcales bacterium]